jgi:signal transduction histidine kinase
MGIEETIINKVFDPFFTTKPTGEAAGVGLYLVRNIINDHNGKISVESQKDEYCQFTIIL